MFKKKTDDHAKDYDLKRSVFNGDYYNHFNANEFDAKVHPYEFVTTDAFKTCVSIIVDLVKVGDISVEFDTDQITESVRDIADTQEFTPRIEKFVENAKVYGSSYMELVKEDTGYMLYNKQAKMVTALYDEYNPQAKPEGYVVHIEREINSTVYTLLIIYRAGSITYEAYINYGKDNQRAVDPIVYFADMIPEEARADGMTFTLDTGLDYNTLIGVQYNVADGDFYGQGDLTLPVLSKLNYYNRLMNMSDTIFTYNAFPKFQGSEDVFKILNQAKEETRAEMAVNEDVPTSFAGIPARVNNFKNSASYAFSQTMRKMRDKLSIFPSSGRGENKYIINEYNMDYLTTERQNVLEELYSELHISKLLYSNDISTGQMSGVAIKRLMQATINHVEDIQELIRPALQKLYYTIAQAEFNYSGELPKINFEGLSMQDVSATIENIAMADKIQNKELRLQAIAYALDLNVEDVDTSKYEQIQPEQDGVRDDQEEPTTE